MYDSEKDTKDKTLLSPVFKDEHATKSPNANWFPEGKFQLISMLFLFFVGFYGIFMVSWTWVLYFVFALFFSPKWIQVIRIFLFGK